MSKIIDLKKILYIKGCIETFSMENKITFENNNKFMINKNSYIEILKSYSNVTPCVFKEFPRNILIYNAGYTCGLGSVLNAIFHNDIFIKHSNNIETELYNDVKNINEKKIKKNIKVNFDEFITLEKWLAIILLSELNNEIITKIHKKEKIEILKKYVYINQHGNLITDEEYINYGYNKRVFNRLGYSFIHFLHNKSNLQLCFSQDSNTIIEYISYLFCIDFCNKRIDNHYIFSKDLYFVPAYNLLNFTNNDNNLYYCKNIISFQRQLLFYSHCYNYTIFNKEIILYSDYLKEPLHVNTVFCPYEDHLIYIFNKKDKNNTNKDELTKFSISHINNICKNFKVIHDTIDVDKYEYLLNINGFLLDNRKKNNYLIIYKHLMSVLRFINLGNIYKLKHLFKYFFDLDIYDKESKKKIYDIYSCNLDTIDENYIKQFYNSIFVKNNKCVYLNNILLFFSFCKSNNFNLEFGYNKNSLNIIGNSFFYLANIFEKDESGEDSNIINIITYAKDINYDIITQGLNIKYLPTYVDKKMKKTINNITIKYIKKIENTNISIDHFRIFKYDNICLVPYIHGEDNKICIKNNNTKK